MANQTDKINNRVFHIVERSAFTLAPSGAFAATLVSLAFLGEHTRTMKQADGSEESKTLEYVGLGYELTDLNSGEVHLVVEECSLSYNPDSKLYSRIIALNGGAALKEGDSLQSLLGKSARIEIIHKLGETQQGGKRLYANINGVSVLPTGMKVQPITGEPIYYDVLTPDNAAYERLNRKHKAIIQRSNGVQSPAQAA